MNDKTYENEQNRTKINKKEQQKPIYQSVIII